MTPRGPLALRRDAARLATPLRIVALLPPVAALLLLGRAEALLTLTVGLGVALGWDLIFASLRARAVLGSGLVAALVVALLAPPAATLWQIAFALGLAVVLGELIFGGTGFGFLSTGALALATLSVSFPPLAPLPPPEVALWAAAPGAALLLWTGLASWRVVLGFAGGIGAAATIQGTLDWTDAAPLAFAAVFLAADPSGAPVTNPARWAFGAAVGGLAAWLGTAAGPGLAAAVFAVLLGNLVAPLLDAGVLAADDLRRERHHG